MPSPRQVLGQAGEDSALQLLCSVGQQLVQRNYSCRMGEIDLILLDGDTLVFVEVRSRGGSAYGGAAATVTRPKQQRIIRAAEHYLLRHPEHNRRPCRFDVVALDDRAAPQWIRDAFRVPSP
ncbi:YraN family protein [Acidithiobacillus sp.]